MIAGPDEAAVPFSLPAFSHVVTRWKAWKNGVPPGREWRGLGAQNPHLLAAFAALDKAEARAASVQRERSRPTAQQRESREAFEARIKRTVG